MHKLHKRSSHSAPYKPHGIGTRKHFFGSKSKKNQKIHDFQPKKWGGHCLTPPPHPQNLKKVGFKWGGSRGVRTKNSMGGCVFWPKKIEKKKMILQGVKLTIQPLGVGYTNSPKKAKMGGMWRFPLYACLALIFFWWVDRSVGPQVTKQWPDCSTSSMCQLVIQNPDSVL